MKKFIIPLLLLISINTFSQSKKDRIKALKVAFLTERLELTQEEAQQFWPVYNAYDDITREIKHEELKNIRREIKDNIATLSDERSSELLSKIASAQERLHDEEVKLNSKLKKIISPKKIIQLKVAEEDFKHKLFEQWKKMKHEGKKP
ncbi:sensor of ECF-type sigma factor [Flaviramulus sp. BrNp1-15]|uniref:sensor of ECF-type sigma factor n=1 Tax=Flaviramulus sp. BrNp1-15 TaxID=2916754 RepID=UPI001EE7D49D|nr:sensor of ECF-type sigma factor [Flaviramulus sp. BrNp1-15]ULC58880.1 sensor of ECF-type sigma factor [Flaviramulus sp. BrNp1-15]